MQPDAYAFAAVHDVPVASGPVVDAGAATVPVLYLWFPAENALVAVDPAALAK